MFTTAAASEWAELHGGEKPRRTSKLWATTRPSTIPAAAADKPWPSGCSGCWRHCFTTVHSSGKKGRSVMILCVQLNHHVMKTASRHRPLRTAAVLIRSPPPEPTSALAAARGRPAGSSLPAALPAGLTSPTGRAPRQRPFPLPSGVPSN